MMLHFAHLVLGLIAAQFSHGLDSRLRSSPFGGRPMTVVQALLAFSLAAALLTITPGLDTALVLRTAAVDGARRAALAGLGILLGCLTWGGVAALGLGAVL